MQKVIEILPSPGGQEQSVLAPGPLVLLAHVQCCNHRRQLHRYVRVEYPCGRTIVSMSLAYGRVVGFLLIRSLCRSFVFFVHVWRVSAMSSRNLVRWLSPFWGNTVDDVLDNMRGH